jgi:tetratricopeptide (TPR) repeat protein
MVLSSSTQAVRAWVETLTLPTYPALDPDPNPMFFDSRDIQRSKGNIYPNPFTDQLSSEKTDRPYQAVFLENEYIQMIMLPELGGRIFAGQDKTNGYDFFYRHKLIKPALIGLLGPWISGGIEFNWPQHHRPSTFMPVEYSIEKHEDGSATIWMSDHDPLNRTKGMVGVCLHPGRAVVETKVRLYNRTPFPQTFLWWENAGVHIDEQFQVVFPPDVHYAQFHTKEFVTSYPISKGEFAGNDYGEGTDVSFWANSPRATSFFAAPSKYDFFGAYDHNRHAGVVHVASRHISPGKKFFTWGNGPFGHQWQRNLMDDTGEYLELMAGAFTDNQPDFSWIMPRETRTFSQFWFPIQEIGPMKNANTSAAVNLEVHTGKAQLGVYATEAFPSARVILSGPDGVLLEETADLAPGAPYLSSISVSEGIPDSSLLLQVLDHEGAEIIRYAPEKPWDGSMAEPYQPPAKPAEIASTDELFLVGLHLEQYRHPVFPPEPYWQEALRRDAGDSRCNQALGKLALQRGDFASAETYLRASIKRLISRNPNPYDGEPLYQLGLTLKYQDKLEEAYDFFYKSTWNAAWQSPAYYTLAQIDCLHGDWARALQHLDRSLQTNIQQLQARNLKAAVLCRLGRCVEAGRLAEETIAIDPLDAWARFEAYQTADQAGKAELAMQCLDDFKYVIRLDPQLALDLAYDLTNAGLWSEAINALGTVKDWIAELGAKEDGSIPVHPMILYTLGWIYEQKGEKASANFLYSQGTKASPDYCFPLRLEEMIVLRAALAANPADARASYYLGNLLYDKKQHAEAVRLWKEAARVEPGLAIPWRNLGLAAFNLDRDADAAESYYNHAVEAKPGDPRILLELDQLRKRKACPPADRLALLDAHSALIFQRDDLTMEWAALNNRLGRPGKVLEVIARRSFHPWEGGEGSIGEQYCLAHWLLGRQALEENEPSTALEHFQQGLQFPDTLGEVPTDPVIAPLIYAAGRACAALGLADEERKAYERVLSLQPWGPVEYYQALALRGLGRSEEAAQRLDAFLAKAQSGLEREPELNFFYQALPSPTFDDDLKRLYQIQFGYEAGLAHLGLGRAQEARTAFARVLELDPSHTLAWEEYRKL